MSGAKATSLDGGAERAADARDDDEDNDGFSNIVVVLCRPQGAQNVGSVARAMANFGLSELRLVSPRETVTTEWEDTVTSYAVFATGVLESAKTYADMRDAVRDCCLVVGTAATSRKGVESLSPRKAAELLGTTASSGSGRVALVLGNERHGMSEEEVALCNHTISIQTASAGPRPTTTEDVTSLNLSHAAAILFYDIFCFLKVSQGSLMERPKQSTRSSRLLRFEQKLKLKEYLVRARRRLDIGPDVSPSQKKEDEKSLHSLVATNTLTARDASTLFSIAQRVLALRAAAGREADLGEALARTLPASEGVTQESGGHDRAIKAMVHDIVPGLRLSKEELGWLANQAGSEACSQESESQTKT